MKLYNEFTSIHNYFAYHNRLMEDVLFQAFQSKVRMSEMTHDRNDALMIVWIDSMLDLSGCIDSPAEHQWHCDPAYCPDWKTQREGIGSLLTVAPIDVTGRLGMGHE